MWSELGSVSYTKPPGCTVVGCLVYILRRSDSVLLLSQGGLVDLVDSSLSQRRAVTVGRSIKIITRVWSKRIPRSSHIVLHSANRAVSY